MLSPEFDDVLAVQVRAIRRAGAPRPLGTADASAGRMPRTLQVLVLAFLLGTVFCTSSTAIHTARAPAAHFGEYRTFAFETNGSAPSPKAPGRSAEVARRVRHQAGDLLEAKGYVHVDLKPDLLIRVAAGRREEAISHPHPGPRWLDEDEEEDFVEGAFVIDAFDATTDELVWHGSARAEVNPSQIDEERLRRAVSSVMAAFPSRIADASR